MSMIVIDAVVDYVIMMSILIRMTISSLVIIVLREHHVIMLVLLFLMMMLMMPRVWIRKCFLIIVLRLRWRWFPVR